MNASTNAAATTAATAARPATRLEHDCIGELEVPADVYWGIHTQRAIGNFTVSGLPDSSHPQLVRAYATVKRACAEANEELGLVPHDKARAIIAACQEIEAGKLADQFPVDVLQGGAGTSTNMNANEVIANRALEILGRPRGDYETIHPNDDVNRSQSTNDTYPAACKIALIDAIGPLAEETRKLARAFHDLADRHADDVTIGRTQLQDAVPMTYGQEFHAFASFLKADTAALERVVPQLTSLNLGATAIGTGICADLRFRKAATEHLARITGLPITAAPDPIAAMTDMSAYIAVSQTAKNLAIHLKKAADDLRLLNSGPHDGFNDLNVPARQAGSSIMPGKVNPVIPESVDQVCFRVFGMDTTVTWAASEGQLQLNAFDPVIIHELLKGINLLVNAMRMFRERCVDGITINAAVGRRYAASSPSIAAALNPLIGYEHAADIAKEAAESGRTVREVAGERTGLPAEQLDALLDTTALARRLGQTCREHREA
ncbi:aspartate ammonia-lyase [Bifidobacterium avesanii]|uniref:Aspartate ammonia-lyase n=1 Tax=Bifidobacterium avesanii TaxID=1798157 RepID=A0A7K3TJF9_9BIFI|nr:aspartate ammonia-lyase [Bifidobacterium avesanii]NEG79245.1 aspartate ammonia-lyase [Bifidobacterium avesanii]